MVATKHHDNHEGIFPRKGAELEKPEPTHYLIYIRQVRLVTGEQIHSGYFKRLLNGEVIIVDKEDARKYSNLTMARHRCQYLAQFYRGLCDYRVIPVYPVVEEVVS